MREGIWHQDDEGKPTCWHIVLIRPATVCADARGVRLIPQHCYLQPWPYFALGPLHAVYFPIDVLSGLSCVPAGSR